MSVRTAANLSVVISAKAGIQRLSHSDCMKTEEQSRWVTGALRCGTELPAFAGMTSKSENAA